MSFPSWHDSTDLTPHSMYFFTQSLILYNSLTLSLGREDICSSCTLKTPHFYIASTSWLLEIPRWSMNAVGFTGVNWTFLPRQGLSGDQQAASLWSVGPQVGSHGRDGGLSHASLDSGLPRCHFSGIPLTKQVPETPRFQGWEDELHRLRGTAKPHHEATGTGKGMTATLFTNTWPQTFLKREAGWST